MTSRAALAFVAAILMALRAGSVGAQGADGIHPRGLTSR
jgi:hypothetical protein